MSRHTKARDLRILFLAAVLSLVLVVNIAVQQHSSALTSPLCSNLDGDLIAVTNSITTRVSKLDTARHSRDQKLLDARSKADQKLAADRAKWDTQRQDNFTKLEAKATNEQETSAVQIYEAIIKNAISVRRAAHDTDREAFRTSVDAAITTRRNAVDTQIANLTSAVDNAFATAKASCSETSPNTSQIRTRLKADLKSARQSFKAAIASDDSLRSQIDQFAVTRRMANEAANKTFEATASAARDALKTAFGNDATKIQ